MPSVLPQVSGITNSSRSSSGKSPKLVSQKQPTWTIHSRMMSHDQRGTNRPVGNVNKKALSAGHCKTFISKRNAGMRLSVCAVSKAPKRVSEMPDEPKKIRTSEPNRPVPSLDLRQKIRIPTTQNSNETATSSGPKQAAYLPTERGGRSAA